MIMRRWMMAALLAMLLPACAMAVTEGTVEEAPAVELEPVEAEISYLPDASYYDDYGGWDPVWENAQEQADSGLLDGMFSDVEQRPRLTAGEAARARALLAKVQAGELAYTGESVLEKMENVVVGVYALDPADYDGETVYTLLPGPCLSDEQLLAIIDAYAQLGLTFDPDALSARNCARGGGIETSRFFTQEEAERYQALSEMIRYGRLDAAGVTAERPVRNPKLNAAYYCGLNDFSIKPYRSLTDEEMVAMLVELGTHDESGEVDFAGIEREARSILCGHLGCPLSMPMAHISAEGSYVPRVFTADGDGDWQGESRRHYSATFSYVDEQGIQVYADAAYDWETKTLVSASRMDSREWDVREEENGVTQERIDAALAEAERIVGVTGVEWHVLETECSTNWGGCRMARARLEDGLWLTAYIGENDGALHGLQLESGTLVDELPGEQPVNG